MLSPDREQFEIHLGTLCAGFNVPVTELRTEAYWRGLQKMQLGQFARMVEFALGEHGPERIPTVPQCWSLWRQARTRAASHPAQSVTESQPAFDRLHAFGQRCLRRYLMALGGVPEQELTRLVFEKNRIVSQFRVIATEEPVTAAELREALFAAFARIGGVRVSA